MTWYKRLLGIITAILMAFFIFINNAFSAFANPAALVAVPEFIAIITTALVAAGVISLAQADDMSSNDIIQAFKLLGPEGQVELLHNACYYSNLANVVTNVLNVAISASHNSDASDSVASDVLTGGLAEWIWSHEADVDRVVVGEGFDLMGYGACLYVVRAGSPYNCPTYMYCDYIVYNPSSWSDFITTNYLKAGYNIIYSSNGNIDQSYVNSYSYYPYTNRYNQQWFTYQSNNVISYNLYGDVRTPAGEQAESVKTPTESETKAKDIGTVIIDGVEYPVAADGTVTIGDTTYPINNDGTVTIGDTTYAPTYDLTNYDNSAIIDLIQDIAGKLGDKYIIDDDTAVVPTDLPDNITLLDISNVAAVPIQLIPFDGLFSIFTVIESATLVKDKPQDIVLHLNTSWYQGDITLIRASIIDEWEAAITTVKILVSIVLIYFFAKWARRMLLSALAGQYVI